VVGKLQQTVKDQLSLVVCGGITPENIASVLEHAGVKEVHAALRKAASIDAERYGSDPDSSESFVEAVCELKHLINRSELIRH